MATAVPASTSYTPGLQTCATLVSQIASFMQADSNDNEIKSVALAGLNSGINLINSRVWKKIYGSTDISWAAGTAEYSVPNDFKEPIRLLLLDSSNGRQGRIDYLTNTEFYEEYQVKSNLGNPFNYTLNYATRKIILDVAPQSAYVTQYPTLRLFYHKRIAKLVCNGTTGLPPEFDEFLIARGALWLAKIRDPAKERSLGFEAAERWHALIRDDMNVQTDYA